METNILVISWVVELSSSYLNLTFFKFMYSNITLIMHYSVLVEVIAYT